MVACRVAYPGETRPRPKYHPPTVRTQRADCGIATRAVALSSDLEVQWVPQ